MYRKWKGSERLAETISHMGNISHPKPKDYRRRLSKRRFAPALELGGVYIYPRRIDLHERREDSLPILLSPTRKEKRRDLAGVRTIVSGDHQPRGHLRGNCPGCRTGGKRQLWAIQSIGLEDPDQRRLPLCRRPTAAFQVNGPHLGVEQKSQSRSERSVQRSSHYG